MQGAVLIVETSAQEATAAIVVGLPLVAEGLVTAEVTSLHELDF